MPGRPNRRLVAAALCCLPLVLLIVGGFLMPVYGILSRAFVDASADANGARPFQWVFADAAHRAVLIRTLVVALVVTAICLLVGYPYAYFTTSVRSRRARRLLLAALVLPYFSSLTMRNFGWLVILGRRGPLNSLLEAFGLGPVEIVGTTTGALIAMCHVQLPLMVIPLYLAMRTVDRRLVLAATSLGARPSVAFAQVFLPLSRPGIAAGCVLTLTSSLGFFITPAVVGSPRSAMLSQLIVDQVGTNLAWGRAAALSIVLLTGALVLVVPARMIAGRQHGAVHHEQDNRPGHVTGRNRTGWTLFLVPTLIWVAVPVLISVPMSFTGVRSFVFPPPSWSTRWYEVMLSDPQWRDAAVNSLVLGLAAAATAAVLGTAAAVGVARLLPRVAGPITLLLCLPLVVPVIIYGVALYLAFLPLGLLDTFRGLLLAHTSLTAPVVLVLVASALRARDAWIEKAALSLGATPLRVFCTVTLPLIMPVVLAGALFAFLTSLDETVVSRFVVGPDSRTLPVQVFNSLAQEVNPTVAAASTLNLAVCTLVLVVVQQVARHREQVEGRPSDQPRARPVG